ncbi:MAG: hypothetical protein Q8R16_03805, partial [bacterium]|nr:hypothetical protein [bacterium]
IPLDDRGFPKNPQIGASWAKAGREYTYVVVTEHDDDQTGFMPGTGYWRADDDDPGRSLHPEDMGAGTNDEG